MNKRKKANQRRIQYNSIGHRVQSTNTVGRIPLIHNIVKISPKVFKRKQATINLPLLYKTNATSTEISPSNKSKHIAKQTVTIINSETTIPSLYNNKNNNNSNVSSGMYKQQQHDNETSKTTTKNSVNFNINIGINNKQNKSTDNIPVQRLDIEKK